MLTMNKRMTLDVLAGMVQTGFLDIGERIGRVENAVGALTLRIAVLEKRMDILEERTENGFYNVTQELQQIRQLIKKAGTREQVAALEVRVNAIEKKINLKSKN